jgi:diketogulonate reductase-like aldo/keto reductase
MGGNDFSGWFKAAGKGAMIQTFHGYGNGAHLAPQIQAAGRDNVFVSTGIPCGCCGSDAPAVEPMDFSEAMGYIKDELSQLNTSYVDLLLFHHRCKTPSETAAVWSAFEAAKKSGIARHIGVSNFNSHDLKTLSAVAKYPIEVLEAHFGVGMMDFEVLEYANVNNIHPVSFSSLSDSNTDLPTLPLAVTKVATSHNISSTQAMYAYISMRNITVLSSYDPSHPEWLADDLGIFDIKLSKEEMADLDRVTPGKRTCPDCYTFECQACAQAISKLGCDIGPLHGGFVWGRSNPHGTECMACANLPNNTAVVMQMCGDTSGGESLETMVPKACGI